MGREIKRVPLDFDYPINGMMWKGYHNPYHGMKCKCCDGSGLTPEAKEIDDSWYGLGHSEKEWCYDITQDEVQALLDAGRLMDFTRVPLNEKHREDIRKNIQQGGNSWLPYNNGYIPTADEVNAWAREGMGHDSINRWVCVKQRIKRLGITLYCPVCKGEGVLWVDEKYKELHDSWKYIEPPTGEGYQLWTTTNNSPMSPVFEKPENLAQWLVENKASWFGRDTATYDQWYKFITETHWKPSIIIKSAEES